MPNDIFEKLADLLCTSYRSGPGMKTPEFIEMLQLQYSPEEAQLAVQIGFEGGKIDELAERTSMGREKLEQMLNTMSDKGTIWIDPASDDPICRALPMEAMGIMETAAMISNKFPWKEPLKKKWNKFKYVMVEEGITPLGPASPVWVAAGALPVDALPSENVIEAIKQADYRSICECACRSFERSDQHGNHCSHLIETCMNFGDMARWVVAQGYGREITCDEAIDILGKCEKDGLVHIGLPEYGILCNCCDDACVNMIGMKLGLPHVMVPSPFVATCDEDTCTLCAECSDRCPVEAIQIEECAVVDESRCIGCGVCVVGCDPEAIRMIRRPEA